MSDDNVDFVDGVIEKKGYREKWLRHAYKHKPHPINYGIHMDTHHLISAEAVNISKLSQSLIDKGYMINDINNLVGFPATLPAACHLGLQLHRGDHLHKKTPYEKPYHKFVNTLLQEKESKIQACYGRTKVREKNTEIHKLLDPISEDILGELIDFELPLTEIFARFSKNGKGGCRNCFDVVPSIDSTNMCESRDHFNAIDYRYDDKKDKDISGNEKTIIYAKIKKWTPKVGL